MSQVPAKVLQLANLLPSFSDIEKLLENEIEARFILKRAVAHMQEIQLKKQLNMSTEEVRYLICALVDKNWERIHSGHFSKVSLIIRQVYALGCYFKIFFTLFDGLHTVQLEQCSAILDEAQLLGCNENLYKKSSELHAALMSFLDEKLRQTLKALPTLEYIPRSYTSRCDIPQVDAPSLSQFKEQCFQAQQPTLLLNTINHWPAIHKWRDLNYLLKVAGNRTVPIEIGSNYACDEWSQQLVKIRDFLYRQFGEDNSKDIEYLAQHELFAQIPDLKTDICVPDYCSLGSNALEVVDIKAWLGPKGTISPMHYDPKHNLLCQVFGCKYIILASPLDTGNLYAHESDFLINTSQIDAANLDFEKYPLLRNVKFYELRLQPGDCLYMPPKWWHYVRSETPSFSVSFWWN